MSIFLLQATVEDDALCIRGSSGVELASGLHWFLKQECKGMSTWAKTGGTQFSASYNLLFTLKVF